VIVIAAVAKRIIAVVIIVIFVIAEWICAAAAARSSWRVVKWIGTLHDDNIIHFLMTNNSGFSQACMYVVAVAMSVVVYVVFSLSFAFCAKSRSFCLWCTWALMG